MTSEVFGEMFEDDSADTCGDKFPLGAERGGLACADPEARTPIGASKHFWEVLHIMGLGVSEFG